MCLSSVVMEDLDQTGIPPPILPPLPSAAAERKRKREEGGSVSRKEPRKAKYMKKILDNDKATKLSSFNKRKPTLKKKAFELRTLCDVPVCVVCYDSNGNVGTWPENRYDVVSLINGYKKAKEHEKRGGDAIGLLELSKKKLMAKVREKMRRNCEEVAGGLSRLFDGLSGDALADSLSRLDSKLKLIKERMETMLLKIDSCEKKELVYQVGGGFGDLEDIVPKLENIVESENPGIGLQVAMVDNEASFNVSDNLGTMVGPWETLSSVLDFENCNNYPTVGFVGNSDLVPPNCLNSDVGTSYGGVRQDNYLVNYNLANGSNNFTPFCQTNGLSTLGFYDSQPTSSIGCNNMVGFVDNSMGLLPLNGFGHVGTSYGVMPEDNYLDNCDLGWLEVDDLLVDGNDPFCQSTSMPGLSDTPLGGYTGCSNAYNFEVGNGGFASQPPQ